MTNRPSEDLDRLRDQLLQVQIANQFRADVGLPFLSEVVKGQVQFEVTVAPTGGYELVARVDVDLEDIIRQLGDGSVRLRGLNVSAMMAFCLGAMTQDAEG